MRGRWSADFGETSFVLYGADEKERLSLTVKESESSGWRETFLSKIDFFGGNGKPVMQLSGFNDFGNFTLYDSEGRGRLILNMMHFDDQDWPELTLAGVKGWRMKLIVHNELPHLIFGGVSI